MKAKTYLHALLALSLACAATACDENAWNKELDGWDEKNDQPVQQVQTIEYTLTNNDYSIIAGLSANVAIAGENGAAALKEVGTLKRFSAEAPASTYAPALFSDSNFPYFTLTNGSSIKLTYNVATDEPVLYKAAANAQTLTVTDDFYQTKVWESEENYINAFAPSKPAASYLPAYISAELSPADGEVAVVTYNIATQEPVFGSNGGSTEEPTFTPSDVIGTVQKGDNVTINGVVTGICNQGYIITDNSGSILVYMGSSFDIANVAMGQQLKITGEIGAYNKGLQVTGSSATVEAIGEQAVAYPEPKVFTAAELDVAITRTTDETAVYGKLTGTTKFSMDKENPDKVRNINLIIDGASKAQGSVYQFTDSQLALFKADTEQTIEGYFIAVASSRYCNFVVTAVDGVPCFPAPAKASRAKASPYVPVETEYAVYTYENNRWNANSDFMIVQPADYTAMGQRYPNLSEAEPYLSTWLKVKLPYAAEGDIKYVIWTKYASGTSTTECNAYRYDGSVWSAYNFTSTQTDQFVMTVGKWLFDPNVTITLPAGKSQPLSTTYFQACVNWVFENICKPMGDTDIKSGKFYVSSYGNNEYYSGTSAFQGNVDLRPTAALAQYAAGYEGMTDSEIVELEKHRFMEEVMPGALATLHADAKPLEGLDVLYTINFSAYDGASTNAYVAVFKVVGPGKFEPVSCTWWENGTGK